MTHARRTTPVLALLVVAAVTMLVFEAPIMRVIGVLALFGFVIAGVFAIADHEFLDPDSELDADATKSVHDENAIGGIRRGQES